ncbi:MAG: pilus assembly protein [Coriobacteriia bacterium]|nr:pilus assembly protein [Coriobacteriia bacterium]
MGARDAVRREAGAAAVEFAIVCILLLMIVVGMVELGRLYAAQLSITHAAREGARLAAVGKFDESAVKDRAFPLDPTMVSVTGPSEGTTAGEKSVEVTVSYPFQVGLLGSDWVIRPEAVSLSSTAVMRAEY